MRSKPCVRPQKGPCAKKVKKKKMGSKVVCQSTECNDFNHMLPFSDRLLLQNPLSIVAEL